MTALLFVGVPSFNFSFGKKRIFMDVDHIPAGSDFAQYIEAQLAKRGVLLAIIGPELAASSRRCWITSRQRSK